MAADILRDRLAKRIWEAHYPQNPDLPIDYGVMADAVLYELGWDNAPTIQGGTGGEPLLQPYEWDDLNALARGAFGPGTYRLIRGG